MHDRGSLLTLGRIIMNIIELIVGGSVGAFFSWLITYIYYRKSSKDQRLLFDKLSDELREVILESPEKTFDSCELKKRLEHLEKGAIDASRLEGTIDGGNF
jgi:hypothetical protein